MILTVVKNTWLTSLDTDKKERLVLTERYDPDNYPVYDNYEAIEVGKIKDIPYDYNGVMGVPVTILQYNLDNMVLLGLLKGEYTKIDGEYILGHRPLLNGKKMYSRTLIRMKNNTEFVS